MVDYMQHIVHDPTICGGAPTIKGARVTLRSLLASVAEGGSLSWITTESSY